MSLASAQYKVMPSWMLSVSGGWTKFESGNCINGGIAKYCSNSSVPPYDSSTKAWGSFEAFLTRHS